MKIVEINDHVSYPLGITDAIQGVVEFDNGWKMCDVHDQDCCENVYADWEHLRNESGLDYDFAEETFFVERVEGGIRFGDQMLAFFVPCYNIQNGYYNSNLEVKVYRPRWDGSYISMRKFHVYADTQDDIY